MKKLLALSPSKIFIFCAIGLAMTLGGFWHYQVNQHQLDRINVLNQGVGTCFNRISQTFTAMMIRDVQSPYLHQGFMSLSNECLTETINGINPFRKNAGKGYETLNQLISETHWFHEKIHKMHAPMVAGSGLNASLAPLSDRFSKIENYKISLVDEIESTNAKIRDIQANDEVLMGSGLIIFVIALSLLSLQEFNRLQLQREIERQSLNYLKTGQANVGAIVDQLVDRALRTQNMPVTAQIFHDYHGELLERSAGRVSSDETRTPVALEKMEQDFLAHTEVSDAPAANRTSLKEILVNLQNIHSAESIQINDVRDVQLSADFEGIELMMNAAINKLADHRIDNKKIMITNQVHSDRAVISLFLAGASFTPAETEFSQNSVVVEGMDMNMIVLKEMVTMAGAQWFAENKNDRSGKATGMCIRFVINRAQKEAKGKTLVSVIRGKKKDISREMMN